MTVIKRPCGRCGGKGGWEGWPGYTCFECGGKAYFLVETKDEEQRAKARDRREAKRAAEVRATQAERAAKCEMVYVALRARYASDAAVQAKIASLEPAYMDNYLIDRFRGEMAQFCHVQVPFGLPIVAEHLGDYIAQLDAAKVESNRVFALPW